MKFSDHFLLKHKKAVLWLESNRFTVAYEVWQLWMWDRNRDLTFVGIPAVVPKAISPYLSETLLIALSWQAGRLRAEPSWRTGSKSADLSLPPVKGSQFPPPAFFSLSSLLFAPCAASDSAFSSKTAPGISYHSLPLQTSPLLLGKDRAFGDSMQRGL